VKLFILLPGILLAGLLAEAQPCVPIVAPTLTENTRKDFEQKLAIARMDYEKDSGNADAIIWYGRRTAYLGDYTKAIEIFSKGIKLHPRDARLYRHRGHRYLTIRCFDKAIADFKKATQLTKGKPDEVEPDGLPNAKNIPTSTLQTNSWYHLGICYFLRGQYTKSVKALQHCLVLSKNPDMYVATANWLNIAYRKLGKYKEAIGLFNSIDQKAELIESGDYLKILEMYTHKSTEKEIDSYAAMLSANDQTVGSATINFGVGYYALLFGHRQKAVTYFKKALASNQWSSFGYIAAEAELARLK
jgi:tetratricopeptide (TPR) repeat protein